MCAICRKCGVQNNGVGRSVTEVTVDEADPAVRLPTLHPDRLWCPRYLSRSLCLPGVEQPKCQAHQPVLSNVRD